MFRTANTPNQVENIVQTQLATSPPPTPYHLEVLFRLVLDRGHEAAAKLLLQHGAEIDNFAIYTTVRLGFIPTLQVFVDAGWDVNMVLKYEGDALVLAVNHNKVDIVRWLLEHGANPTLHEGWNGRTTLGDAAVRASPEIISMLVKSGTEIRGSRALELAARAGHLDNVLCLLDIGADPDEVPDPESWCVKHQDIEEGLGSALHAAASEGHYEIVSLLLERGADAQLKDSKGRTALDRARSRKYRHVPALLKVSLSLTCLVVIYALYNGSPIHF
jgi:ankyrin repeat protein